MKITKPVPSTDIIVTAIECDKCKQVVEDVMDLQEMITLADTGGFGSVIGDGISWELDICESCFYEIFKDIIRIK